MNKTNLKQLEEINIIRPFLICFFLVMYHAFAPYGGVSAWHLEGVQNIETYYWIDKFVYSFMLETFVFISGYVFAFQLSQKNYTFKQLLKNKFKRLIIPSIVFSSLYVVLFYDKPLEPFQVIYDIINGVGHLWFLPMLFWCFVLAFVILKIKINEIIKLVLLLILSIFSFLPLPLQLGQTCYYLFFFYAAIVVYRKRGEIINSNRTSWLLVLFILIYVVSFVYFTIIREDIIAAHPESLLGKIIKLLMYKSTMIFYSIFGVSVFYLSSLKSTTPSFKSPLWLKELNKLCMGIYIAHQFILMVLYHNTVLPFYLNSYWLPWAGYGITLLLSLLISYLFRLTSIGRKLI